jgi:hypothetical protein
MTDPAPDPTWSCPLTKGLHPYDCAESYTAAGLVAHLVDDHDPLDVARDYCDVSASHDALYDAIVAAENGNTGYEKPQAWRLSHEDAPITIRTRRWS